MFDIAYELFYDLVRRQTEGIYVRIIYRLGPIQLRKSSYIGVNV